MVMWLPMWKRCGAGSRVAGMLAVAALALTGCVVEADGDGEDIGSVAQALCTGVKLSSDATGTLPLNGSTLLTANNATCADGEVAEYRFMYKLDGDPAPYAEFRGWSTEPTATFDNTDRPSGIYTLQVRARNVGSTANQNSASTVVITSGEVCTSATLSAAPKSPVLPGKIINLSAQATCTGGTPEFRYFVKSPGTGFQALGDWTELNAAWDTTGLALGKYNLRVYARRAGNLSAYEATRSMAFELADTCRVASVAFSPVSPAPAGTVVDVNAEANCVGETDAEFRFHYRLKGSSAWLLVQDWSGAASAPWDTTGLAEGTYQMRVQTRSPGVLAPQASKSVYFKVTAP